MIHHLIHQSRIAENVVLFQKGQSFEFISSYMRQMYFVLSQLEAEIGQRTAHPLSDRCQQLSHLCAITQYPTAAPRRSHMKSPCSSA